MTQNGIKEFKMQQLKADCLSCGKAIHEMCGQHATDRKEFGKALVRISELEDQINKMKNYLENIQRDTFNRIENKIDELLTRG
jgi:hypothetical protein